MSMRISLWTALAIVAVTTTVLGQRGMGMGPMHYDVTTETTLSGTVDEVITMQPPGRGMGGGGIHLMFSAATGSIEVHVGPSAYVQSKSFTFAKGDALTIVGSKTAMNGKDVVLAREITKGDQKLTLRDEKGFPLWSGRATMQPPR